jgi:hypothetical protein
MTVNSVLDAVKYGIQREFTKTVKANNVFAPPTKRKIPEDSYRKLRVGNAIMLMKDDVINSYL